MLNFGNRLRALRHDKGWTQEDLAKRLGVTKSVISAYETSLRYPSYDILIRITAIFKVTSDYLLGIERTPSIDVDGLTPENEHLVRQLIDALRKKQSD